MDIPLGPRDESDESDGSVSVTLDDPREVITTHPSRAVTTDRRVVALADRYGHCSATPPATDSEGGSMTLPAHTPTRTIRDLSADERDVIRKRNRGWESASPALLARVFDVPVQAINAVLGAA